MKQLLMTGIRVLAVLVLSMGLAIGVGTCMENGAAARAAQMCQELDTRIAVWKQCDPEIGCMATYQDVLKLTQDVAKCKDLEIAP